MPVAKQRSAHRRHLGEQLRFGPPIGPPGRNRIIEIEYRYAVAFLIDPRRCTVRHRLTENQQRSSWALVGVPDRRVKIEYRGWGRIRHLVATADLQGTALSYFDRIQLPDHPRQTAPGSTGDLAVIMRFPRRPKQTVTIVRIELPLAIALHRAILQMGSLHAETITLVARTSRIGEEFV